MSRQDSLDAPTVLWFLPTSGDGRYLGTLEGARPPDFSYIQQVAQAADTLGYYGVLIPTGRACEDSWVVASALAPLTRQLRFLIAARPGFLSPTVVARMTATLDRISDGRVLINVVAGGDPQENAGDGLFLAHNDRYDLTREFLTVYKGLLAGETVNFKGRHIQVADGRLSQLPVQTGGPPLYFGGSSDAGISVAANAIDTYLTWGEPPGDVAAKLDHVRAVAAKSGRKMNFGIRLHVIVRETSEAAWAAAEKLIAQVDDETIEETQRVLSRLDSVGQKRMSALHGGRRDKLEVSPNLWAGVGLVRGGAGTALVGDPDIVSQRIREYQSLGISTFVLSGYPHLEEAYRFAELVFPKIGVNPSWKSASVNMGPFGEQLKKAETAPREKSAQRA